MLSSATPVYFQQPFANNAGVGYTRAIPNTTADTTAASLDLGFPPACFVDVSLGGTPPNGMDFNGIFNEITANLQWVQAGGFAAYDSAFSTAIGGYPNGAILAMATGKGLWRSTVDDNATDPDTSGVGWAVESISPGAYYDLDVAGAADVALTLVQAANNIIDMTGVLTGNINVIVPTAAGQWTFVNSTTGTFTITVKTAAGTGVGVIQGGSSTLYCDGTNVASTGSVSGTLAYMETPSGAIDGANKTFTFAHTPIAGTFLGLKNTLPIVSPSDYTMTGAVMTTTVAPQVGETITAWQYRY